MRHEGFALTRSWQASRLRSQHKASLSRIDFGRISAQSTKSRRKERLLMMTRRDLVVAVMTVCTTLGIVALAQSNKPIMRSSAFDWNAIEAKPQKYGARRQFFQAPTATLDELECHATTLNPGETTEPPHRHPEEAIVIVKEGTLEVLVNGELRRVGPGSVVFQASNQLHSVRNAGQTPATYHVFKWFSPGMSKAKPKQ